ncbi:unnamed protein product [Notodromas monacha]|uniref:Uncharacterized protein n=1 Tax=Notodromas monacha TaxID=399045 RepID=A0A7R9BCU8_9CRUS|nr:unnamed protein product [Notodromas monacha]CAG0912941.1 unnamed protein product [Notodromas monacha]
METKCISVLVALLIVDCLRLTLNKCFPRLSRDFEASFSRLPFFVIPRRSAQAVSLPTTEAGLQTSSEAHNSSDPPSSGPQTTDIFVTETDSLNQVDPVVMTSSPLSNTTVSKAAEIHNRSMDPQSAAPETTPIMTTTDATKIDLDDVNATERITTPSGDLGTTRAAARLSLPLPRLEELFPEQATKFRQNTRSTMKENQEEMANTKNMPVNEVQLESPMDSKEIADIINEVIKSKLINCSHTSSETSETSSTSLTPTMDVSMSTLPSILDTTLKNESLTQNVSNSNQSDSTTSQSIDCSKDAQSTMTKEETTTESNISTSFTSVGDIALMNSTSEKTESL